MKNIVKNFLRTVDAFNKENPDYIDWDSVISYSVRHNIEAKYLFKALEEKGYDFI